MSSRLFFRLSVSCALLLALALPCRAEGFTVFTNIAPPVKFMQDGEPSGVAGELLKAVMGRAGLRIGKTVVTTHEEGIATVMQEPGTLYLAISKMVEQKDSFKWVGPVYTTRFGLIARRSKGLALPNFAAVRKYSIGSVGGSVPHRRLLDMGIPEENFVLRPTTREIVSLLVNDKVDLLAFAVSPTFHILMYQGSDPNDYESLRDYAQADLYFAFNSATDDVVIAHLQKALDDLKRPGPDGSSEYEKIVSRFYRPL